MDTSRIVVGSDGSSWSSDAVRWAAHEARRRGAELHIVLAYEWDWPGARFDDGGTELKRMATDSAEKLVARAATQAHEAAPELTVRAETVLGQPAPVLLAAAEGADLLVVGSRGRGGFSSLLLGSVGLRVATLAPCSVVVVRGRRDDAQGPVVVGVDGSPSSLEALRLGLRAAAGLGVHLVAVRAYAPPATLGDAGDPTVASIRDADEEARLRDSIAPLLEPYGNVDVEVLVARGGAARALVGLSDTARLVVVGSRGHGALVGSLLGSVGLQLLHHADCPVLVSRGAPAG